MNMNFTDNMIYGSTLTSYKDEILHKSCEQSIAKPGINDVICHKLDGDALKNALFVIDNILENRMQIKWSAVNTWSVKYKRKQVCDLRIESDTLSIGPVNDVLATSVKNMSYNQESIAQLIDALRDSITDTKETLVLSH